MMTQNDLIPLARYMVSTMDALYTLAERGMHPMVWSFKHPQYIPHPPGVSISISWVVGR